ncbi:MAG: TonB-dependent receptor [Acetobacteraceae bacterium]|nr:TonB-dependent receptor [Acetobacteraceae bacterium]
MGLRHRIAGGTALAAMLAGSPAAQTTTGAPVTELPETIVVAPAPLPTSAVGVPRDRLPYLTRSLSAEALERGGRADLPGALERELGPASRNEAQSNPFQPDFQFRGFTASPLLGTPQGLAVYQNGVRINEAFGDAVNWDLIPENAIRRVEVLGSNPVFGLNALGGALSLQMKDGFTAPGARLQAMGGSFGRWSLGGEYGVQVGNVAAYLAAEGIGEDGWRRHSPSRLRRLYGDIGFRGERAELHLSLTAGRSHLTGNGPVPVELLAADRRALFTYPDRTTNDLVMLSARANYAISDRLSAQALAYVRRFRQSTFNADIAEFEACDDDDLAGLLCTEDDTPLISSSGQPLPASLLGGGAAGVLNRTRTHSTGAGGAVQLTSTATILGRGNTLVAGLAFDHANTDFTAGTELGVLTPDRTVIGLGEEIAQPDGSIAPVRLRSTNTYWGLYASDTLEVTERLALTAGARLNIADLDLNDQLGTALSGKHRFTRLNLSGGATYRLAEGLTLYANYAEANRTPTPAELSCADPLRPCALGAFFLSDPSLKQVVSRTVEAGLRGDLTAPAGLGRLTWNLGFFRSDVENDIMNVASKIQGRGFFRNAGTTRRQGVEAGAVLTAGRYRLALDYAFIDATFQDELRLPSPNNPFADAAGTILVRRGDHLPGIPQHRLRLNADLKLTDWWSLGATLSYTSGQYLRGDEANQLPKIGDYTLLGLRTSIRLGPGVELFALATNLLNARYATFGTLFNLETANAAGLPLRDPRSISPGAPRAVYGGIRIAF